MAKVTPDIIDETVDNLLHSIPTAEIRKLLWKQHRLANNQIDNVIKQSKEKIQTICHTDNDTERMINMYVLRNIISNDSTNNSDRLKAVDILNRMMGQYTERIELNTEMKFVLGTEEDDWTDDEFTPTAEEIKDAMQARKD